MLIVDTYSIACFHNLQVTFMYVLTRMTIVFFLNLSCFCLKNVLGLKLKTEDDQVITFAIAEAPFNLIQTERLKSIHGEICISLHDKMVDNVRCHFLKPEESESMDSLIQQYEDSSPAVVAVLFVNPSENIRLDDTFITHRGESVQIPMFSTSLEVGKQIESIASKCEISDVNVKCEFMLKSQHEQSGKLIIDNIG